MPRKVEATGPSDASVMIVGESPGEDEELEGAPFIGSSGKELTRQLREAGINRDNCYITNVCKYRPPKNKIEAWTTDKKKKGIENGWFYKRGRYISEEIREGMVELYDEIERVQPSLIIAFGNLALWALTGEWGITKWRGSQLEYNLIVPYGPVALIPTLHPAGVLRQWSWRHQAIRDLQRAAASVGGPIPPPPYHFVDKPNFAQAFDCINQIRPGDPVALDVETGDGRIVCIGISRGPYQALCLPLVTADGPYWLADQSATLLDLLRERLAASYNIGQNFAYDAAYFEADFGWHPRIDFDTYNAQSVLWPGEPRTLGFLSSIYCFHHRYWKDDAKEWFKLKSASDYDRLFLYNCEDAARTHEIALRQRDTLKAKGLMECFESRMLYDQHVFDMSMRGVLRDPERTAQLDDQISETLQSLNLRLNETAGHEINPRSSPAIQSYLYKELGLKPIKVKDKVTDQWKTTADAEAIDQLIESYPEHEQVLILIRDYRSLASLRSNFLRAKLEPDGRLRSAFAACGTETFRLTSKKNAFNRGCNLLNITADSAGVNLRNCILPDPGYLYFDCDLERADLQVVVWEANDEPLKRALRDGVDIHLVNAIELYGITGIPYDECFESHPNYHDHVGRVGSARALGKRFVHLTDYGGKARKCASACGITVHEAEMAQRRWFALHPGIQRWHKVTAAQLSATRTVTNRFGYRRTYFDRVEALLPEALAWVPQSTVAIVASEIHRRFDSIAGVEVQLQCYDSVAGQVRADDDLSERLFRMHEASSIIVPYPDPLIIPLGLKTGPSWGEVKARSW